MKQARELLLKHLYLQGGDELGISDGRVYNACLDAINEALTIPDVVLQSEQLFCGGCGGKRELKRYSDLNSGRSCINKLCKEK